MPSRAAELIETLGLRPHPEGGFIYFLLTRDTFSRWHRVRSDEVWHLYEGGPLELLEVDLDAGLLERHCLGRILRRFRTALGPSRRGAAADEPLAGVRVASMTHGFLRT